MRTQTTLFLVWPFFTFCHFLVAQAESGLASTHGYGKAGKGGELTCAHRTRAFGSVLDGVLTAAGRFSAASMIAARLSAAGSSILSVPAAKALGMMSAGVVRVSVE